MPIINPRSVMTFALACLFLEMINVLFLKMNYVEEPEFPNLYDFPTDYSREELTSNPKDDLNSSMSSTLLSSQTELYPAPWPLVDIQLQYLLNNPICHTRKDEEILIVILIHSHAGNSHIRSKIRESLSTRELQRLNIRRVFLLASPQNTTKNDNSSYRQTTMKNLEVENSQHFDLVIGDFVEAYRNLTYKHLMGLEWATRFCPTAQFIVKQDDDTVVDYYQLSLLLHPPTWKSNIPPLLGKLKRQWMSTIQLKLNSTDPRFIMGIPFNHNLVHRNKTDKWFVNVTDYPSDYYPGYTPGFFYITTVEAARDLVSVSRKENVPYFWIDDVHVTGTLRQMARIELMGMEEFVIKKEKKDKTIVPCGVKINYNNRVYWCHYVAGLLTTTPKDLKLISVFQENARHCFDTGECQFRE